MERLNKLICKVRGEYQAICDDNPNALEAGDSSGWHDNFAYEQNLRDMHRLAKRVRDLEIIQAMAEVVPVIKEKPSQVVLGVNVLWCFDGEEKEQEIWVAGFNDGDPASGRVSYNSPLGSTLIGAKAGDELTLRVAGIERTIIVLEIGPTPTPKKES